MTHPDRDSLLDHALGLLTAPARAEVEAHVQGCPACASTAQALAEEQEALRAGLAPGADPAAVRAVERRVLESVRGLQAAAPAARRGPRRVLVAAAVLAAVTAGSLAWRSHVQTQRLLRDGLVRRVARSEQAALEVR